MLTRFQLENTDENCLVHLKVVALQYVVKGREASGNVLLFLYFTLMFLYHSLCVNLKVEAGRKPESCTKSYI